MREIGLAAAEEKILQRREKFDLFRDLLLFYNEKFNLTAITERREIEGKHFLDSVAGEEFLPQGARVLEVGSGAGFPSIPLKLVRDDLSFTLVESIEKKCRFLETAIKELGLTGMEVVRLRAEEAGRLPAYRERSDAVVARAVARLNTLSEYCLPLVGVGGIFLAWKGDAEEELTEARRAIALLGGDKTETFRYELPDHFGSRTLVRVKKNRRTPEMYPRGRGKERSRPL